MNRMTIDYFIIIDKVDFCSFLILRKLKKVKKKQWTNASHQ